MKDEALFRQTGRFRVGRCGHVHLDADVASGSCKCHPVPLERPEIIIDKQKHAPSAYRATRHDWLPRLPIHNRAGSQFSKWSFLNHGFAVSGAPAARTPPGWPQLPVNWIEE
jgi:hypothetical protein